jgi:hypothetical protein
MIFSHRAAQHAWFRLPALARFVQTVWAIVDALDDRTALGKSIN